MQEILTGSICLDIDDVALGPVGTAFVGEGDQGLHKDGVLRPRLETPHQPPRVVLRLGVIGPLRRVNVHHRPAVGATCILPVKLRHVLIRTSKTKEGKTLPFRAYRSEHHRDMARGSYTPRRAASCLPTIVQAGPKERGTASLVSPFPHNEDEDDTSYAMSY